LRGLVQEVGGAGAALVEPEHAHQRQQVLELNASSGSTFVESVHSLTFSTIHVSCIAGESVSPYGIDCGPGPDIAVAQQLFGHRANADR
jgi:hypothetical protein